MTSDYAADVMSIETFFSGNTSGDGKNFPLRIPDLQRSFVWEPAAVRGFWEDMQDHRLAKGKKIHEMFGGTVVLFTPQTPARSGTTVRIPPLPELKTKTQAEIGSLAIQLRVAKTTTPYNQTSFITKIDKARVPSEVIDGQQRLTVLMIGARILDEMGDVKNCQKNIRPRLRRIYRRYANPRLEHLGSNETIDFKNVLGHHKGVDKLTTGWSNGGDGTPIKAAYEATLEYFKEFIKGGPLKKRWKEFSEFMLEETTIVCLETTEFHQSHLVFKSLNWKGRKLRASELFKSILFHFSLLHETNTNRSKVQQSWLNIVRNCTSARPERGDAVSEFLHDWCRSVGKRRSDFTGNKEHDEKELKLDETLQILENMLKHQCPRSRTNTGKVLNFVRNLEEESGRYAWIWKPTSALNSRTNQWIDLIDLRRIFSQGGLTPILLFILRQKTKVNRDHGIRVLMQCTIFAVIPEQQRLAGGNAFSASDFAKETRMWVKDLQGLTPNNRLPTIKEKARTLLEKDRLYSFVSGNKQAAWIRKINKRWKSIMTLSGIDPGSAKLLLRYIERINIAASCPIALDYTANYDKDRLQAEHIFPKSAKWGTLKESNWKKEWNDDPRRWPSDENERNSLKWRIGNYILLEREVNNACKARTWKGYPRVHPPSRAPPKYKKGKSTGKQNFAGFGKIHFYKHYHWTDDELTGPLTAGTALKGSQLQCVENLINKYRTSNCWTQTSVKKRTNILLTEANGSSCPNIDLKYLW